MKIRRASLIFNNILSKKIKCNVNEWYEEIIKLRNAVIKAKLFATGPVFYKVNKLDNENNYVEYTFYIPVNERVNIINNDEYCFYNNFIIKDGLTIRCDDLQEDISWTYDVLKECASEQNLEVEENSYYVYVDVYGEPIVDVYLPIKGDD